MKLSDRDKKLLMILAILAVFALPYFIIINPLMNVAFEVRSEILGLQAEYAQLSRMCENEEVYKQAVEDMAVKKQELLNKFPEDLTQESTIMFICNTENLTGVSLYQISLGDDIAAQIVSEEEAKQIDAVEQATGDVTDDSYIVDNTVTTEVGKYSASSTSTQFTFRSSYEEFKRFVNYIEQFEDRMVITDLSASYMEEADMVNGSFTLIQYAIEGEDRVPVETVVGPDLGTDNIFKEAAGSSFAEEETMDTYDYFIMLSNTGASVDAKIIGKANDAAEQSYLTSTENSGEKMRITFTGSDGNYAVSYKIGTEKFPAEGYEQGVAFTPGDSLDLQIISSPRINAKDEVAADINIINETDMPLNVHVVNDDTENPRVAITGKTGDIAVD